MQEKGAGWILFAWIMLFAAGTMSVIDGIIALGSSSFWNNFNHYIVFWDLHTWGWIVLLVGVLQILAAFAVIAGSGWGRWVGIAFAALSMIGWMFWFPIMPWWAGTVIVLDVLVIYALAAYGGKQAEA